MIEVVREQNPDHLLVPVSLVDPVRDSLQNYYFLLRLLHLMVLLDHDSYSDFSESQDPLIMMTELLETRSSALWPAKPSGK